MTAASAASATATHPPVSTPDTPSAPGARERPPPEPPFVGRDRELGGLLDQLDAALAGRGGAALLAGEPGIGKTRTAQRLAAVAQSRGGQVLWGRAFDAEWSPPFAPWIDALDRWATSFDRDHGHDHDPEHLRLALGPPPAAAALAALVPALRAALPDLPPPAPLAADEERVRIHDAVAGLLLALARRQPCLLVIDDLHWADPPSLDLLRYLGRALPSAPILVAATYRGEEIAPRHPLAATLAELHRVADARVYGLGGLARTETAELLRRLADEPVAPSLVAAIHAETEGNPFFVRELFRHLLEEGRLQPAPGAPPRALGLALADGVPLAGVIPDGVRQIVGRRLARLGDGANRLLGHAAIANAGFDFPVLQKLTGMDETALLDALDEALASGLMRCVDERREAYDFVHAIVRHTLAAEWSPSRKVRLHRRLAEALEHAHPLAADDPDRGEPNSYPHAAELAIQYHASAALPGAGKGVRPALRAADAARAAADRAGAVRFLRIARDLAHDLDPAARAGLLAKLALAEADALLLADARHTVEAATAAMQTAGAPPPTIAGFLGSVALGLEEGGAPVASWQPLVERGLALLGDHRDLTWARLCLTLKPFAPLGDGPIRAARWLGSDPTAVALARASGEEDDFARTIQPFDDRRPAESRALRDRARRWRHPAATIRVLTMVGADWLYQHGNPTEAIAVFDELRLVAERHGSVAAAAEADIRLALAHLDLGHHDHARRLRAQAETALARLGPGHHLRPSAAWVDALLADHLALAEDPAAWAGIAEFWEGYVLDPAAADNALVVDDAALAAYAHARAGHPAAALRLLTALAPVLLRLRPTDWLLNGAVSFAAAALWSLATAPPPDPAPVPPPAPSTSTSTSVSRTGAAPPPPFLPFSPTLVDTFGRPGDLPELADTLRHLAHALAATERGDYPGTSTDLALARLATLLGHHAEAAERFARTRLAATTAGRRPLAAIVDHDEALALLFRRDGRAAPDLERASSLATSAERAFRALGMAPWAARAAALAAAATHADAPGRGAPLPAGLSQREVDVLRLVAQGCSDRVIGDRLFLSPRTVNAHVRNMLRKTDHANRTELSVWAMEHGLVAR